MSEKPSVMPSTVNEKEARARPDLAVLLFVTLLGTYGYFWQSRDWNTATRLMLSYSLVDRHQVCIDGLERQAGQRGPFNEITRQYQMDAGDLAYVGGHFYTDKAPGQSFLGAPVYAIGRLAGLREHPLETPAIAFWPSDYLVTLGTSGVATAALAVVIYAFSLRLGAPQFAGVLLGLAYGLGTPALVYATLFYGHQASAFCTATSFFLLYRAAHEGRASLWNMLLSGLLAGYSLVAEYQTAGITLFLAVYAMLSIRRPKPVLMFLVSAVFSAAMLAVYNYRAFGSPLELSYAHEVSREFQKVHSLDNPLGLRLPSWKSMCEILRTVLWGRYRGLVFYAPVLLAAPLGLVVLCVHRRWGVALVTAAVCAWMLAVNVTYPLWEGGWCTGPRFLLPAIPFAVLAVAGLCSVDRGGVLTTVIALATLAGAVLMLGCVAVGGRFPSGVPDPVVQIVLPHWRGEKLAEFEVLAGGRQFEWNIGRWLIEHRLPAGVLPPERSPWQSLQMAPLGMYLLSMTSLIIYRVRRYQS